MAYKVFTNGSTLPASELNTYLMDQAVIAFATSGDRSSNLTSPIEGQLTWLDDAARYEYYNGTAWVALTETPISTESAGFAITAADKQTTIVVDSSSDVTVTVDDVLEAGQRIDFVRKGTGNVTFSAGSGVTINSKSGWLKISDRYSAVTVLCEGSGVYYLIGSLSA